ncbi:MAG: 30S ribosomal protein S4 [Spirochaetes bacterium GWF1_31_7]|nr:MAG: 30S ribosomal protein S4 [Spirochaetes bacterium GWE1_32_154]OHD47299.1 MAG: 30S ribosomal protein S4 [Spirochaetes bacterium GWE2_31_10]OHD47358.1 MAG: 30S ribosomal protein S4 [Spirochaetes bacterium GWF1_31_7]HBD92810.1 30S ribosomal protein S4 [Spirochaetia bacterium]HBI37317.1 30S ribosomal protein S4 [Spirochaetia bacterium]
MARNTSPRGKIVRRFGINIFGSEKFNKLLQKKPNMPGKDLSYRKKKLSVYGTQLIEKQKAKLMYGVLERQFKRYFEIATSKKGKTGENLISILESRLDNVVYRMHFAQSRRQSRQIVLHKHITVNGQTVNIPSYQLKAGDVVSVTEGYRKNILVLEALKSVGSYGVLSHIEVDADNCTGTFKNVPEKKDIPDIMEINEQLIVELYSK